MFILKVLNILGSFVLPVLVWQSCWLHNPFATNLLNFGLICLLIISTISAATVKYINDETKLELKVKNRKAKFNNETLNYLIKCLDISVVFALAGFGHYIDAVSLIISMVCISFYKQELDKV
jgi:hypothetical protein